MHINPFFNDEYMVNNMTPTVKVLQIYCGHLMEQYQKLADHTENSTKEKLQ